MEQRPYYTCEMKSKPQNPTNSISCYEAETFPRYWGKLNILCSKNTLWLLTKFK